MSELQTVTQFPHFINGEKSEPGSERYIPVYSPATGELIAEAAEGSPEDLDAAVRTARQAFDSPEWRCMTAGDRSRLLYAIANTPNPGPGPTAGGARSTRARAHDTPFILPVP